MRVRYLFRIVQLLGSRNTEGKIKLISNASVASYAINIHQLVTISLVRENTARSSEQNLRNP